MKLKEITDRLGNETDVRIYDRNSEKGTVYQGKLLYLRTFWNEREVVWLRADTQLLHIEIE